MTRSTTKKGEASVNRSRLRRLFRNLLDIYSPSGKEEQAVDYLYRYLKRYGLPVVRQAVDDNRDNLIVKLESTQTELAFVGHIDTVSAYELQDVGYREQGDWIKGLGAADMKGGCAAMIEAFISLVESGRRAGPLLLALVVGEEENGDGSRSLIGEYRFPWAMIGEPTDMMPCLSHYGYIELQLTTRGRRLHASMAKRGQNSVDKMLRILLRLSRYLEEERAELVYNIRDLFSSGGGFVVPDGCEARVDIHVPPDMEIGEICSEIERTVAEESETDCAIEAEAHFVTRESGYVLAAKGRVVEALKTAFMNGARGWKPSVFPSHSDANQFYLAGVMPIVVGCGRLQESHAPEEAVRFSEVVEAAELYYQVAVQMLSDVDALP
ncbi:MAG: M20/M25/M40 family metallo-hydrolase [Deltaproteobacteria bacterium]|nr:M20/M25/M40 family metallo-hydrolase [Deltaproteobacteria bacterium]